MMTEGIFESGVKLFDLDVKLFGSDINPASGKVDQTFFVVYTNEEKFDCCKEMPMMEFVCIRAETKPDCTGVRETPDVCMGVAGMPSV